METPVTDFETRPLPVLPDAVAPDGSEVRILSGLKAGGIAHFRLGPGQTSKAVTHRKVEEIRYFVSGRGRMWRRQGDRETVETGRPWKMSRPSHA
jgi:mannose-6-phosphate isomerase-like protein (cupin superfamily)